MKTIRLDVPTRMAVLGLVRGPVWRFLMLRTGVRRGRARPTRLLLWR